MDYSLHKEIPETDQRQPIWAKQREERGFDDTELWALDSTIVKFVLPRLKRFRENVFSFPHSITFEEWKKILDKMIAAFEECGRRVRQKR